MLDGLAACAHGVLILVKPRLRAFENVLVHPSLDTALRARRALRFEWTGFAGVRPIVAQLLRRWYNNIRVSRWPGSDKHPRLADKQSPVCRSAPKPSHPTSSAWATSL